MLLFEVKERLTQKTVARCHSAKGGVQRWWGRFTEADIVLSPPQRYLVRVLSRARRVVSQGVEE